MSILDSLSNKLVKKGQKETSNTYDDKNETGFISYFQVHLQEYADKYNSNSLKEKIYKYAKTAGIKFIYQVLLIYNGLIFDEVPTKYKLLAVAALGYFISPLDIVPDFIPGGLIDDGTILTFALMPLYSSLGEQTRREAVAQLHTWFGDFDESELPKL